MHPDRWEHGSDFHLMSLRGTPRWPWASATFATSGREALRQLVALLKPSAVWLPSYYCADVAPVLAVRVQVYPDDPRAAFGPVTGGRGDLFVRCNTWGLRTDPGDAFPAGVTVVEDHTHDPFSAWASGSRAAYAFASLRKTLPIADGAALWSAQGLSLPPQLPPAFHAGRWRAMELKAAYLSGEPVEKDEFRKLYVDDEEAVADGRGLGASQHALDVLDTFPTEDWTRARRENFARLPGEGLLRPAAGATAFAATYELPTPQARDALKRALIAERIYPAVLWPIEHELARRVLSIHCDGRYGPGDMARVAEVLTRA